MIFCTVGTEKYSFDRLVKAVDELSSMTKEEAFIQIGSSTYKPKFCKWEEFISFDRMIRLVKEARVVICHAGVGSTLLCLSLGKVPVIVPRKKRFGEHVDNHQLELSRKLDEQKRVIVGYDLQNLASYVKNYEIEINNLVIRNSDGKKHIEDYLINVVENRAFGRDD